MVVLRRKAIVLFAACLVLLFFGLMAYQTEQQDAMAALGARVNVVVAARDLAAWTPLDAGDLALQQVPARFTYASWTGAAGDLVGRQLAIAVPAGSPIPAYALYVGPDLQPGEMAWELRSTDSVLVDSDLQPGDQVAVLAATASTDAAAVRRVLLAVRVLSVRREEPDLTVVLALTLDQGESLMAAENYDRQVRVVRLPRTRPARVGANP